MKWQRSGARTAMLSAVCLWSAPGCGSGPPDPSGRPVAGANLVAEVMETRVLGSRPTIAVANSVP